MSGNRKLASNINRLWNSLAASAWRSDKPRPVAACLSPAARRELGDRWVRKPETIDTWAWGWMIRMSDGSFRP